MPQQWQDDIYLVQPPQFMLIDQHMFGSGPQLFVLQPATAAGVPGQQVQDAVTRAKAMSQMMSSVFSTAATYAIPWIRCRKAYDWISTRC